VAERGEGQKGIGEAVFVFPKTQLFESTACPFHEFCDYTRIGNFMVCVLLPSDHEKRSRRAARASPHSARGAGRARAETVESEPGRSF
jgi:hypothetical protein